MVGVSDERGLGSRPVPREISQEIPGYVEPSRTRWQRRRPAGRARAARARDRHGRDDAPRARAPPGCAPDGDRLEPERCSNAPASALPDADLRLSQARGSAARGAVRPRRVVALAIHHLDGAGKRDLFRRVFRTSPAAASSSRDVVVPEDRGRRADRDRLGRRPPRPARRPARVAARRRLRRRADLDATKIWRSCGLRRRAAAMISSVANPRKSPSEHAPTSRASWRRTPAQDREQLDHDVEDRAGREREEQRSRAPRSSSLADDGAEERRAAADQAEQGEERPARLLRRRPRAARRSRGLRSRCGARSR